MVLSETFEEIYIDSQIEQWVEYKGDELGLTQEEKFYWSTLLTSLRESGGEFRSQLTSQIRSSLSSIRTQQTFNSWFSQLLSENDLTMTEANEQFKQKIKDMRQQIQNADIRSKEKTSFLKRLVEAGAVKGIALSLGSMFLGGFPLGAIFGLQTLIQVPFELGTDYLEDQIESVTREHQWRQAALTMISELESQRQNQIQQAVLNQVKKSEIDMKQMEAIVESARAIPNTQMNLQQSHGTALDKYAGFMGMALEAGFGFYLSDMGPGRDPQSRIDEDYGDIDEDGRLFRVITRFLEEKGNIERFETQQYIEGVGFRIRFKVDRDTYLEAYMKKEMNNVHELLNERGENYDVYVNGFPVSEMDTSFMKVKKDDEILIAPVWRANELPPLLENLEKRLFDEFFKYHKTDEGKAEGLSTVEHSIERKLELGFNKEEINAFHEFCRRLNNRYRTKADWQASGEKSSPYTLLVTMFVLEIVNIIKKCEPEFEPFLVKEGNEKNNLYNFLGFDFIARIRELRSGNIFDFSPQTFFPLYGRLYSFILRSDIIDKSKMVEKLNTLFNNFFLTFEGENSLRENPYYFKMFTFIESLINEVYLYSLNTHGQTNDPFSEIRNKDGKTINKGKFLNFFGLSTHYFSKRGWYTEQKHNPNIETIKENRQKMIAKLDLLLDFNKETLFSRVEAIWDDLIEYFKTEQILRPLIDQNFKGYVKNLIKAIFLDPKCPIGIRQIAAESLSESFEEFSKVFTGSKGFLYNLDRSNKRRLMSFFKILGHIATLTPEILNEGGVLKLKNDYEATREELEEFKIYVKEKIDWWLLKQGNMEWKITGSSRFHARTRKVEALQYEALQAFYIASYLHEGGLPYGLGRKSFKNLYNIEFPKGIGSYISSQSTINQDDARKLLNVIDGFINELDNEYWLMLDLGGDYRLKYDFYEQARQKLTDYIELKEKFQMRSGSSGHGKPSFQCDIDGFLNDLNSKKIPLDKFHKEYISHLEKINFPKSRRGRFPREVIKTRNRILKIKGDDRPRYYRSSYFSTTPTSHFSKEDYRLAYILLRNKKTDLVYDKHPDESEFEEIREYADSEGEAIRNVKDTFRVTGYDQVHHNEFIEAIFEDGHRTGVFAVEIPVWYYDEASGWLITGHIDTIKIVGKIIYIVDYKPDYVINLENPEYVGTPFFDAVPQLASYAIMFEKLFHDVLQKWGYEVRCAILNENAVKLFNPKNCLALYTAMFELVKPNKIIPWKPLVSDDLVEYYKDAYRNAR